MVIVRSLNSNFKAVDPKSDADSSVQKNIWEQLNIIFSPTIIISVENNNLPITDILSSQNVSSFL